MARIAVTGGTGMIGRVLCRHLGDQGHDVVALSRRGQEVPGITVQSANILDPSLDFSGFDQVVHAAAFVGFGLSKQKAALMHRTNVDGTRNVLDAAVAAGIERVLHVSSVAAIGRTGGIPRDAAWIDRRPQEFHSAYERSKYEAHIQAHRRDDVDVVSVLPSIVLGHGESSSGLLVKAYLERRLPAVPRHPGRLAFVHVEDVAAGAVAALERGSGAYVLSEDSMDLPTLFSRLETATGVPAPREIPFWLLRLAAPFVPALNRDFMRNLALDTAYDSSRARDELGWRPNMDRHLAA
ncbi:MAG: NAD-dependent epimerase/dehydratase family protein [Thermoplasmatota archaeon]